MTKPERVEHPMMILMMFLMIISDVSSYVQPGVIKFTRLYVANDGLTHLQDCSVQNLIKKNLPGGKTAQYVRNITSDIAPTGIIMTQQIGDNPWHQCPTSQFVVTLDGTWYINSTFFFFFIVSIILS